MSGPVFFCSISSLCSAALAPSVPSPRVHARTHRHVRAHAVTATFSSSGIWTHACALSDRRPRAALQTHAESRCSRGELVFFSVGVVVVSTSAFSTPEQTHLHIPTFVNVLFKTISAARSDKLAVCIGESTWLNISQGPPDDF